MVLHLVLYGHVCNCGSDTSTCTSASIDVALIALHANYALKSLDICSQFPEPIGLTQHLC